MPPIISVVGKSSTGKTTFLEKLIREITVRGYKVATIKHSHHSISFDDPNKDSWRHARSGAVATIVSSTTEIQMIKPVPQELTVEELARNLGEEYDIILSEGFSRGIAPKIEIHRKETGPLLENTSNLIAIVTNEPLENEVKQFGFEDVKQITDLIEEKYLKPNRERVSLYINGQMVQVSEIDRRKIIKTIKEMPGGSKNIPEIKTLDVSYNSDISGSNYTSG
jgi:molybdopterin-guanine dinucleotide biosynthesis adapter protein